MTTLLQELDELINTSALRLTELNNRMQKVNKGGVYELPREIQRYVSRQMIKRDRETATHRMLVRCRTALLAQQPRIELRIDGNEVRTYLAANAEYERTHE